MLTRIEPHEVLVIIPALNEAEALPGVLSGLKAVGLTRIRVADNGSHDGTAEVAREAGAEVIHEPVRGYGQACWSALQHLPVGVKWILFCDADGSDDVERLPDFFEAAREHDLILGDRRRTATSAATLTLPQRWGNFLATTLIRLGWGHTFHDLGPLRLIRREALERIAMEDRGFGWTIEMQIRAVEEGLRILELPVRNRDRQAGRSKISGTVRGVVMAGTVILGTWLKFFLRQSGVQNTLRMLSAISLLGGALMILPFGDFDRFGVRSWFWAGAGFLSIGYILSWGLRSMTWGWFLFLALALRGVLYFMFPGDDVWRYLWEGMVQNQGFNPYVHAPASEALAHLRTPTWELIQHREISAIYPPLTQGLMRIAALLPGWGLLKGLVIAADMAVAVLLARRFGTVAASRYTCCPLVLVVFAGGAHFDSWMLLAMVLGWFLWEKGRWRAAAFAMGTACGIKYVAAPLLGWMLWQLLWKSREGVSRAKQVAVASFLALLPSLAAVCVLPGPWDPKQWLPQDFALYARSADFVPRLVAGWWEASLRMNTLYVLPVAAVGLWAIGRSADLPRMAERWFLGLMLFSPLVHGWYFTWALPFAASTGHWGWRLVGISGLVYFQLQQTAYEEQDWWLSWPWWLLLWMPLVLGSLGEWYRSRRSASAVAVLL